jgi:Flp pilus assembly protein TadG
MASKRPDLQEKMMRKLFKKLWNNARGNALIIFGASLPLLMGAAGLASDTIQWALWKRELQRAADSAAIAGVYAVAVSADVNESVNADLTHNNDVADFTVDTDIEHSPLAGAFTADPNAVRVLLVAQKKLSFSSLFLESAPTIRGTATATIVPTGDYCVVSLESTAVTGISVGGSSEVDLGCGMITNSTSMDAAVAFGSSEVDASPIAAVGGIDATDNWADGTQLLPFTLAQADPFAGVPVPSLPSGNCPNLSVNSNQTRTAAEVAAAANTTGLPSGHYCFGDMSLKGTVTLPANSVLIIDGGDFDVTAQANVTCSGCTIVLTSRTAATNPSSIGNVTINGGATLNMSASTSGTYAGILMYQDRRAPLCTNCNKLNGNSSSFFQGAFYFPTQEAQFNGTTGMTTNCIQLVARRVTFTGNSGITNSCPSGSGASSFEGRSVRLVE